MVMAAAMSVWFHPRGGAVAAVLCGLLAGRLALAAGPVPAQLAEDGRSFRVTAPGMQDFQAGWSAAIERGGQPLVLSSADGEVSPGAVTTIRFAQAGIDLLFRLEPAPGNAGCSPGRGSATRGTNRSSWRR